MRERVAQAIDKALDGDCGYGVGDSVADVILPLIEEAVTAERERCAELVERDMVHGDFDPTCEADIGYYDAMVKFAAAIRGGENE